MDNVKTSYSEPDREIATKPVNEELKFQEVDEKSRTYVFVGPGGSLCRITYENVRRVCVRPSGGHRLEQASGRKVIVAPGWLTIELVMDKWSF